ncbi:MAG: FHA domain-containing protein [Anaerolineae bacterium]|nr:FHA domain-containing protein [Anaerolineae bacterium]
MNDRLISQLEARLEKVTEGIFAHFFGKRIQAHEIALQLVRALEDGLQQPQNGDSRPLAPDQYTIRVNPDVLEQVYERYPTLASVLSAQIIELAAGVGYRLKHTPNVYLTAAPELAGNQITVIAQHAHAQDLTTGALQPIEMASAHPQPVNPQLIISGQKVITLDHAIIHIGRSTTNDIVLEDAYVSRAHAQIRLRFGHYVIFDTSSNSGTYVNEIKIREHQLRAGDVIRIGKTSLVYMEDEPDQFDQTDSFNRV